ncbi:MAG: UDP-N-acetylenolpyruvoylglucosamine reductase [Betaproteobacteria bacterium SG8_39]|nr:MAG: UDP-N-acetylenolpyruvoylglucosamine reductase [Betaproteobacteria bacterium SG8_39]
MNMADQLRLEGLRGELRLDEPLVRYVSWRAGGRARRLYRPADLDDLSLFLARLPAAEPLLFIGLGSNLLVRDGGYAGSVVLMHAAGRHPELLDGQLYAEAGVASPKVARFAARNDLAGAEFLAGVPGSVGGALAMNAGCYGAETWDIVERVLTIDRHGVQRQRSATEFETGYRHCALKNGTARLGASEWFAAAWFRLVPGNGAAARARIKDLLARRVATQPLALPNAGSVFRNPPGDHAARLIEACGLKGLTRGGARVSEKHANFIVNPKGVARASDIEWLIESVRATVRERTGIDLVAEVRIVGDAA